MTENMTEPGYLCIKQPLPGMGRGVTETCKKTFEEIYFKYKGKHESGLIVIIG